MGVLLLIILAVFFLRKYRPEFLGFRRFVEEGVPELEELPPAKEVDASATKDIEYDKMDEKEMTIVSNPSAKDIEYDRMDDKEMNIVSNPSFAP